MSGNCRFALDEKRNVIDAVNVANSGKVHCNPDEPEDDKYLRQCVLYIRLMEIMDKLIINSRPMRPSAVEWWSPNRGARSICYAALYTIRASHLNTFDPAMSTQHKFDGKLRRQKKGAQDFTSLALFRDDVECLLRDLYGDIESDALDSILWTVFVIVQELTKYACPGLWKEHEDAVHLDYMLGIGVPEQGSIGSSDHYRGMAAKFWLILRVYEVQQEPSAFSDYTIDFANRFSQQWDCSLNSVSELVKEYLPSNPHLRDQLQRSPALSRILPKDII